MRPRQIQKAAAILAATLALVGLAACGDDATSTTGSGGEPSKEEFIATVDGICTETTAEIDAGSAKLLDPAGTPTADDLRQVVKEVSVPLLREQYEAIAELEPPAGDEEEVEAIVAEAETAIDKVERNPNAMLVIVGEPTPFDAVGELQVDYGITKCGGVEQPS